LIAEQARAVAQLQLMVERLTARVQQLERRLGRNSGNSSMPPSTDELAGRPGPAPKPAPRPAHRSGRGSGRGRGKQRGAPGAGLGRAADPDVTVEVHPCRCAGCGASLAGAAEAGVIIRQQFDLPPVRVAVTEYRLHKRRCRCGRVTAAAGPAGLAPAPTSYGPNVQALVAYLLVYQHLPVQRAAQLVTELTGTGLTGTGLTGTGLTGTDLASTDLASTAPAGGRSGERSGGPSTGFVHGVLVRVSQALAETEAQIKARVAAAAVVHVDETPLRAGPGRRRPGGRCMWRPPSR
jgi:hypothetical protein